ncbi:alpha/beta-hydrolase [Peniophora sp. CONT]|nr:alpha/beta-hydrolase [Peniophora sp. CONT]
MPVFSTLIYVFSLLAVRGYAQSCNTDFDWSSLTPAPTLNWVSCYTAPLECCRFEVPLDYTNPDGEKAAIAMIRIPSTLPTNSTGYRGPILFNPGGPGGSGVDTLTQDSGGVQSRIDAIAGAYDFVTFDPRGVGRSTPQAQRFPDELSSALWGETSLTPVLPALSIPGNIGLTLAKGEVTNAIFGQNAASYLRHINTPNTAADMLQIVQAYGQEKITYYGTSYGTALGATFASTYPDKIERMVLDGVVDAEAYYAGNYTANMLDTDAALDTFFQTCYEAGPDRCAFYDSSPSRISDNFDAFHEQLKTSPLAVFNDDKSYGILDYTTARQFAREMLYSPFSSFPAYAEALALAQKGNGSALYALTGISNSFTCDCVNTTNPENGVDALLAIGCNDAVIPDMTNAEWEQYYETAANVSKLSEVWVGLAMRCSAWPVPNEEKLSPKSIGASNTSFPILFISNTIDPVTPHAGAEKMSGLFPGSALLIQNTTGHTSASASSNCTLGAMAAYLANGTLPVAGTVCQVEGSIIP